MRFKIVKLLLLSIAFFGILLATSMLVTSVHSSTTSGNLAHKPANDISMDDPVSGGFQQITPLTGDPVGGGFP